MKQKVLVHDLMQSGYSYFLTAPSGRQFDSRFNPDLTPSEMLHLGVFGGKYMSDCGQEFPTAWFKNVKFCHEQHISAYNYFGVNASQPLWVWREKGWINEKHDPRGWFQWYCRYYLGRRLPEEDARQIKRWIAMRRHLTQLKANCPHMDLSCRRKQRQALLHWAYDTRKI